MGEPLKISYKVEEADFIQAYERFWRSSKQGSETAHWIGGIAVLLGALVLATLPNIRMLAFVIVGLGALLSLLPIARRAMFARAYRSNLKFTGPIATEFSNDVISTESKVGASQLNWDIYSSALESDDAFLLMITKQTFSIVPKRDFQSASQIDEFRALVERKLGSIRVI